MRYRKLSDLQRDIETFNGKWELSPGHELTYRERGRVPNPNGSVRLRQELDAPVRSEAGFKASLVAAEPDALVVSVTMEEELDPNPQRIGTDSARTRSSRPIRRTVTGLVKLSGKWELDEKNRITFSVKRPFDLAQGGGPDKDNKLTFQSAWEVNENCEVVYKFEVDAKPQWFGTVSSGAGRSGTSRTRRRVAKVTQELVFKGEWDISEKNKLTYLIGADSDSAFRFRGTFETQSILAKEGEIRYQAGVEYKTSRGARKRLTQTIALFGKWKLSDDLALSFEIEYADGRKSEIRIGADFNLPKAGGLPGAVLPDQISVNLVSRTGKPLGLELVLTKDFYEGDAQLFVRFVRTASETRGEFGVKIPW